MRDLAPHIHRQRLVIEGYPSSPIHAERVAQYLARLSAVLRMRPLGDPVTHRSERYGEAGWIHWEDSGAHFYAWEFPLLFFSADIYTCKPFDVGVAVRFTENFFQASRIEFATFTSSAVAAVEHDA